MRRFLVDHRSKFPAHPSSRPSSCVSVVAAARIDVSGVRNSCVSESISAARSRSPSREASMRAVASMAMARAMRDRHLRATAVATSRERLAGRHASAPTARMPTISARAFEAILRRDGLGCAPPVTSRRLALNNAGNSARSRRTGPVLHIQAPRFRAQRSLPSSPASRGSAPPHLHAASSPGSAGRAAPRPRGAARPGLSACAPVPPPGPRPPNSPANVSIATHSCGPARMKV